jgi:hypothetical protein
MIGESCIIIDRLMLLAIRETLRRSMSAFKTNQEETIDVPIRHGHTLLTVCLLTGQSSVAFGMMIVVVVFEQRSRMCLTSRLPTVDVERRRNASDANDETNASK